MLMQRQDIIVLKDLSTAKDLVAVENIPSAFKPEFQKFFFGKTLVKENNALFAYPHDIKQWVHFIFDKYKN